MSEYVKKSDVEANYVRKDEVKSMIDAAVKEATAHLQTPKNGKDGKDGRGIVAAAINGDGNLCFAYTDGTLQDLGRVKGDKGDKGDRGDQGEQGEKGDSGKNQEPEPNPEPTPEPGKKYNYPDIGYIVPFDATSFKPTGHFTNFCIDADYEIISSTMTVTNVQETYDPNIKNCKYDLALNYKFTNIGLIQGFSPYVTFRIKLNYADGRTATQSWGNMQVNVTSNDVPTKEGTLHLSQNSRVPIESYTYEIEVYEGI